MSRELTIELSVRVSDGSFEASLSVPVTATKAQWDTVVQGWLGALQNAVNICKIDDTKLAESEQQ